MNTMKWIKVWQHEVNNRELYPGEKRVLSHHKAEHHSLGRFTLKAIGGFVTVKEYRLEYWPYYWHHPEPLLTTYHLKLGEAQAWAEDFVNGGTKVTPSTLLSLHR